MSPLTSVSVFSNASDDPSSSTLCLLPVWAISLIIFVLAWIGQFYGHEVEGKKPSFFKDLQFLLIGPAWVIHYFYKKLGIPY